MSGAGEWARTLAQPGGRAWGATLSFERLGLTAQCRALTPDELSECAAIGGERARRYALYLSCDALREAGVMLADDGVIAHPFDITERLPFADAQAAGDLIIGMSGGMEARVRLLDKEERDDTRPLATADEADSAGAPLAVGRAADGAGVPLAVGRAADGAGLPLAAGRAADGAGVPLAAGRAADNAGLPLAAGRAADGAGVSLAAGHAADGAGVDMDAIAAELYEKLRLAAGNM